jgi:hypothetical protein
MSDNSYERVATPFGTVMWAHLVIPDTKFNPEGDFKTGLIIPASECAELRNSIQACKEQAIVDFTAIEEDNKKPGKKAKAVKLSDIDPYEELEDGSFEFKLKRKACYIKDTGERVNFDVPLIDARGVKVPNPETLNIGNGSVLRARIDLVPYNMATSGVGVSLRLIDCQIRTLVEYIPDAELAYDDVSGDDGAYVNSTESGYDPIEANGLSV